MIAATSLFLIAACTVGEPLLTHHLGKQAPGALQSGSLVLESGCIFLEDQGGHRWLVLWPRGYSMRDAILYQGGEPVAQVGQPVTLAGGEYSSDRYATVRALLDQDVPEACRSADYWLATGVT